MPKAYASGVVPASADDVWQVVRDFNGLAGWLPGIEASEIEGGGEGQVVGAVRRLTVTGAGSLTERLVRLDDSDRSYTYEFVDPGPFAAARTYRSTIRVAPVTETGHAFVEWSAWFDADASDEPGLTKTFTKDVYAAGLAALRSRFGG